MAFVSLAGAARAVPSRNGSAAIPVVAAATALSQFRRDSLDDAFIVGTSNLT